MFIKKSFSIFLHVALLGAFVSANDCPKWFPMPANGLVVMIPIYDESITGPDLDCDEILDTVDTDIDGDGLSNISESANGTNPRYADTDGDGVSDNNDAFPTNSAETTDTDGDGVGNNADTDDDGDGVSDTQEIAAGSNPLNANSIAFKALAYTIVTSPHTGRQWLDRNLGATMVCSKSRDDAAEGFTDASYTTDQEACFGGYFQWGRKYNGHEVKDSDTSPHILSEDVEINGEFITSWSDWRFTIDDVLWSGVDAVNNVCPSGFEVPTIEEIIAETTGLSGDDNVTNRDKAFKSFLKLPSSGVRNQSSIMAGIGQIGVIYSSTINSDGNMSFFGYGRSDAGVHHTAPKTMGMPVRCIKHIDIVDTTAPTVEVNMPASNAPVEQSHVITVTFSEPMDRSTLVTENFSLIRYPVGQAIEHVNILVSETGLRVFINRVGSLFYSSTYRLSVAGVKDRVGNTMSSKYFFHTTDGAFRFRTKEYKLVTSPYTYRVWLDRNLGANQACTSSDDAGCYGDYYQWGRNADGHQVASSDTTDTLATNVATVGHSDFITDSDWASVDTNGATRTANWSATDGSSVCPAGYRVPTETELRAELLNTGSAQIQNSDDAFHSFLALPGAGHRDNFSGSLSAQGWSGYLWTSSVYGSDAYLVHFGSSGASSNVSYRAYGFTVRCLRD